MGSRNRREQLTPLAEHMANLGFQSPAGRGTAEARPVETTPVPNSAPVPTVTSPSTALDRPAVLSPYLARPDNRSRLGVSDQWGGGGGSPYLGASASDAVRAEYGLRVADMALRFMGGQSSETGVGQSRIIEAGTISRTESPVPLPPPHSDRRAGHVEGTERQKRTQRPIRVLGVVGVVAALGVGGVLVARHNEIGPFQGVAAASEQAAVVDELAELQAETAPGRVESLKEYPIGALGFRSRGETAWDFTDDNTANYLAAPVDMAEQAAIEIEDTTRLFMDVSVGPAETAAVAEVDKPETTGPDYQVDLGRVTLKAVSDFGYLEGAEIPIFTSNADPGVLFGLPEGQAQAVMDTYVQHMPNAYHQLWKVGVDNALAEARPEVVATVKEQIVNAMGLDPASVTFLNEDKFTGGDPAGTFLEGINGFSGTSVGLYTDDYTSPTTSGVTFVAPSGGN